MNDRLVKLLSSAHTTAFRLTRGVVGRRLVDNDMLLLTTMGRRTGAKHTVPLLYLEEEDVVVIIASYGGRPHHPDWYRNLMASPEATVQIGHRLRAVVARTMNEFERAEWWPRVVAAYGDYDVYQRRTSREIPLVALEPASVGIP